MRPRLPATEQLVPYLAKIDETRIYTNHGPLVRAFEERLAEHFGLAPRSVTAVANATLGLALALAAQGPRPGTLCIVPAWTFVATAHAAVMAGLIPYFVDVDAKTWTLDPDRIDEEIARAPGPVSAIVPVAAFGQPVDIAAWDRLRARTGLAVVIDAAAGFDSLHPGATPAVVSLHATKVVGVGEGGFVACTDASLIRSIRSRANFGFHRTRQAFTSAVNAKLSEYHAAVGLAALDEWTVVRDEWMRLARVYRAALADSNRLQLQHGFGQDWIASTCMLTAAYAGADHVAQALAACGIDTRRWWADGAHVHPATATYPRSHLPVTEVLARTAIGVPFYRDLAAGDIRRIADALLSAGAVSDVRSDERM